MTPDTPKPPSSPPREGVGEDDAMHYEGVDWRQALYRNVTVSLHLALDVLEGSDDADALRALPFVADAMRECWRVLEANRNAAASLPPRAETREPPDHLTHGISYGTDGVWWCEAHGEACPMLRYLLAAHPAGTPREGE